MMDSIFITGGTGNTGQAVLRLLASDETLRGARITCLCRPGGRGERLLPFGVRIVGGDSSSAESLKKAYQGERVVIHISSIFHAAAILEGCRGMRRLIAVSSTRVFSKTWNDAARIEAAERAISQAGVGYTVLRPTMIYGTSEDRNISRLIRFIGRCPVMLLPGGGRSVFQPVHVDDVAASIIAALRTETSIGRSYDLPGGSAHSLREIVEIIAGILGKRVLAVPFPLGLAEAAVALQEKLLPRPIIHREQIARLRENKQFDYSEAAKGLGYAPRTLAQGVLQEIRLLGAA